MFGINFEGHPELYPLLLSDELMGAWPWRKDYKGYPDLTTGERAVEITTPEGYTEYHIPPTPAEIEAGTVVVERPKYPSFREREEKEIKSDSEMIMHLGPQHAMVPGPFLLDILVEGERVKKAFLDLGYIHKGIEKIMENRTWLQGITYTDRMCYVASLSNNECYCGAVEKILGLEVPERAQYIRVILEELSRIQSHLIGTGEFLTLIAGVGYAPWQYMIMDREKIISLIESVTGARLTHTFVRFGGVRNDLPEGFAEQCRKVLPYMKSRTEEFIELFAQDPIYHARMENIGSISPETAKRMGCSGPSAEGDGRGLRYAKRGSHTGLSRTGLQGRNWDQRRLRGQNRCHAERDFGEHSHHRAMSGQDSIRAHQDRGQDSQEGSGGRGLLPGRGPQRRDGNVCDQRWWRQALPGKGQRAILCYIPDFDSALRGSLHCGCSSHCR